MVDWGCTVTFTCCGGKLKRRHASITSTQIYTSLDFQRLAQVYDAAHPRARKKD